jgi:hypothetical protein
MPPGFFREHGGEKLPLSGFVVGYNNRRGVLRGSTAMLAGSLEHKEHCREESATK